MDENSEFKGIDFNILKENVTDHIIKVIGVGGGGGNAVKNMFEKGVSNVDFAVCNTDQQALANSPIPVKVQIGDGLGVGGDPEKGRKYALEDIERINQLFDEKTRMVFVTAGMGGGTGTGAAPVIAKAAKDRGLLTVGVVTIPFRFEKKVRIQKALLGVEELKKNVDSILVINNERLMEIYADGMTTVEAAFAKADEILTVATRCIAEIITNYGIVSRDFNDVQTIMKDGGSAIMSVGYGRGENRVLDAMKDALNSPLINNVDIERAQGLLYVIYSGSKAPVTISESADINDFMEGLSDNLEVLWGLYRDESLEDEVKVTIIATGFDREQVKSPRQLDEEKRAAIAALEKMYYPKRKEEKKQEEEVQEVDDTPAADASIDEVASTGAPIVPKLEEPEEEPAMQGEPSGNDRLATGLKALWARFKKSLNE